MKVYLAIAIVAGIGWYQIFWVGHDSRDNFGTADGGMRVVVDGQLFILPYTVEESGVTVANFLAKSGWPVKPEDEIFPARDTLIYPGMTLLYTPARDVSVKVEKETKKILTTEKTVSEILAGADVHLDEDDLVEPKREVAVSDGETIVITRVEVKEEVKDIDIMFKTKTVEDDELSWRKKIVTQKGVKGVKRTTYRVSYHDGKEVNRRTLKTETVKEPVEEIVTQGTLVKTGKSHRGAASWYAWTGTMAAANPWLPKGSFVRVTNLDNGKSVIVVINDRGPFVPGRIIDLDKVAFEKIASLGAGVINVKMEEITN